MTTLGIDPGLNGAVAILSPGTSDLIVFHDAPTLRVGKRRRLDLHAATLILVPYMRDAKVAIEDVHAMPMQGVSSMFSMGYSLGAWHGILTALGISYEAVPPQRWRKLMLHGYPHAETPTERKAQSVMQAQRLFPQIAPQLAGPRGGVRDGRADALLIAEWLRRTRSGQP